MWINDASYRLSSSLLPSLEARGEALILRRRIVVGPAKLGGQLAATFQASNQVACTMARPAQPLASCFSASSSRRPILSFAAIGILLASCLQSCSAASYGKPLGKLSQLHHGVSGEVFAVDGRTLYIKDLTYDGEGPAAYFYAGNSKTPIDNGFRVPDERGTYDLLRRYRKEDITLTLPEGKTLNNIRWFAIWCDDFSVNFGDVRIPRGFEYPRPKKLGTLNGIHGVSSEPVVIVDAQTLLIPGFSYDGEAPDAKFWAGPGPNPTPQGIRIPDENGKENPLRKYDHKTIVLTLPGDLTVHELGHFGVWCEAFTVDFGHVKIPQSLNVPPSLKMLGVSPQSKLNCEVLQDDLAFEVRWAVAGDSVVVQLVAKLDAGQYMSFGLSPDPKKSIMVGGDVVVAWVDKETLQGYAVDYFLDAKSQCSGQRGSCPDTRIQDNSNSVRLLNAAMVNGYSIVTYQRPLKASDELDVPITTNGSQAIIWAIGPLNERKEVSFHSNYLKKDQLIEFGRPPRWNCPMPDNQEQDRHPALTDKDKDSTSLQTEVTTRRPQRVPPPPAAAPKNDPWEIPPIHCSEPADGVFYAQMGPTGGKHGYPAITGHVGWGISWYINGLLIPEINVVRGKKYTFVVEGGSDPEVPARYHPFYITDDPIGGYQHKTPEEKENVRIFAGVKRIRGTMKLTGVGRLCNWVPDQSQPLADEFSSFGAYQRTLTLECDHGEPGIVEWTPDADTPDTVYYQCFTHRHLGWKINVHDECDEGGIQGSASEVREVYAELPGRQLNAGETDQLVGGESIRVSSKNTIEAKMSQVEGVAQRAKNTGFKPESVVVEGGFKPILRVTEVTDYAEDRRLNVDESDDAILDSREYAPLDSFEPMFVPSPPDGNQSKKLKKKAQRNKRREAEEDTQPAADSPEAYYLPPSAPRQSSRRPESQAPVDGALITADGTQVLDANLARSIPKVNERPGRVRLSSDVLSKTPQYGSFRGELPPPIPGNFRPDAIPQLQNTDRAGRKNPGNGNTRLTLVQRSKRAPHHVPGHNEDDDTQNMNSSLVTNAEVTPTNQQYHDHSQLDDQHDHHNHYHNHTDSMDHADHDHAREPSPSAGELVMANIEYIVLTVVLYFVI
ncbi:protein Skeletor, isoforms B/C isoform X1 [Neodiprion lecontei]|uniref:Protein Skeletor, isoforms B/C isoform X1 n=1 Tax=Neodiprion lecontei TaxID=441921 RepID=A0A6J0BRB8_NEOLC|nr:protein Skeletor, isoforms B/C isoform X1 [Neodiprion lecontei]